MGCFTQGRQPHHVANPSTASASCVFNSGLRETARRCQPVQDFCSYLLLMFKCPKAGRQLCPWTVLLTEVSLGSVYFPVFLGKKFGLFPFLGLKGWCSVAAGLGQRKSVLHLAVQALCRHGAEAHSQPCSQIHSICKHFTPDQYLVKSKSQEGRMGRINAEGHSLHPSLLIYCPVSAVTVKNCNPFL